MREDGSIINSYNELKSYFIYHKLFYHYSLKIGLDGLPLGFI